MMENYSRHKTIGVRVGKVRIGGGSPIVVQSMTNTDTGDVNGTVDQIIALHEAGSELVRFTVKDDEGAIATPLIKKELINRGYGDIPLVGDFHYNGDKLLTKYPALCESLDKFRINPGNVGFGNMHDTNFETMVKKAIEYDKPVRIGVNGGSLDQIVLTKLMDDNTKAAVQKTADEIFL
ncbi:MAG TPA: flavodoxin-dependent (E)-4-hydroxy-3-methylbut-2-enyl-diphosphate synthase, partial [Candidatus Norongarragalinales archaeon]|nr:flavodoxin-dependent (E)-4-hydroxy-3-methylbut-2-enyl-diphosphate synthase [Candidatus Norongarragalinales archaeon]